MDSMEMKDRIAHIIRAKNLTAAEFAFQLGIQPSNVSHLLAGRNNPSLELVRKLKDTFPEYSLDWIVMGKGPMTVSDSFIEAKSEPVVTRDGNSMSEAESEQTEGIPFVSDQANVVLQEGPKIVDPVGLKSIIMVYSDNSFVVLSPK